MEKLFRGVFIVLGCLLFTVQVFAADDAALQIKTAISGNVVTVEQILSDDKVMISVTDANNQPLLGLAAQDFVIFFYAFGIRFCLRGPQVFLFEKLPIFR